MPFDDQSELFYHVDKNDKVLGSITRQQAHADKTKIHRAIFIVALNKKDQVLLQKRSQHKDIYPHYWTISCSGHVTYRQTYLQAAKREFEEELGLKTPPLKLITKKVIYYSVETEASAIYTTLLNSTPTQFDLDEISKVQWIDLKNLHTFISKNLVTSGCLEVLKLVKLI